MKYLLTCTLSLSLFLRYLFTYLSLKIIGAYLRCAKLKMLDDPTKESFLQA